MKKIAWPAAFPGAEWLDEKEEQAALALSKAQPPGITQLPSPKEFDAIAQYPFGAGKVSPCALCRNANIDATRKNVSALSSRVTCPTMRKYGFNASAAAAAPAMRADAYTCRANA